MADASMGSARAPQAELARDEAVATVLHACEDHFPAPDFLVRCDASGTVWVSDAQGLRSVGLAPWLLRRHSAAELIDRVESKLAARGAH